MRDLYDEAIETLCAIPDDQWERAVNWTWLNPDIAAGGALFEFLCDNLDPDTIVEPEASFLLFGCDKYGEIERSCGCPTQAHNRYYPAQTAALTQRCLDADLPRRIEEIPAANRRPYLEEFAAVQRAADAALPGRYELSAAKARTKTYAQFRNDSLSNGGLTRSDGVAQPNNSPQEKTPMPKTQPIPTMEEYEGFAVAERPSRPVRTALERLRKFGFVAFVWDATQTRDEFEAALLSTAGTQGGFRYFWHRAAEISTTFAYDADLPIYVVAARYTDANRDV